MKINIFGVICLSVGLMPVLGAGPAVAEYPAGEETVTLESLLDEAVRLNPGIQATRERMLAAAERPAQARVLPDPKIAFSLMPESLETRAGPLKGKTSIKQGIPFYGKRALRGEAALKQYEVAKESYRAAELKVRAQVVGAYYELHYLRRAVEILGEQVELFRHFARVAEKKYAVGKQPQAMVFRAQAELSRIQNDVVTAKAEVVSTLARLNSLLDRKPWRKIGRLKPPAFPSVTWRIEDLRKKALNGRPEIRGFKALEGKTEARRKLAFKRFFPDFVIGYEHTRIGGGETKMSFDGKDAHGVMLGLNLPIWGRSNKARYKEAEAKERAATLSRRDLVNRTLFEIEDLHVRADTAMRLAQVDENTILPQIRAALKATLSGYEADAVGFLDLLDVERTLLKLELGHVRHKVMFRQIVAQLERVVGEKL